MFLFTEQEEGHAQLGPGWTRRTSAFLMILISVKTQRRQTVSLLSDLFSTHLPKLPSERESASTDRESMRQLLVAERAVGGKERCLGDYGKLKVSYPTEKYTWEKKIGDVETGRERKFCGKISPGTLSADWCRSLTVMGTREKLSIRAGQNGRLRHCTGHNFRFT